MNYVHGSIKWLNVHCEDYSGKCWMGKLNQSQLTPMNSLAPGDLNETLEKQFRAILFSFMTEVSLLKLPPDGCDWTLGTISQNWFR